MSSQSQQAVSKPQGRSERSSAPRRQPARIRLSGEGGEMRVSINKIQGSLSVGHVTTVTHHHHSGRPNKSRAQDDSSDSDTSSSDSDTERFFASRGVKMPSKQQFREMDRRLKQMGRDLQQANTTGQENYVHRLIVKDGAVSAFDRNRKPVKLQSQTVQPGFWNNATHAAQVTNYNVSAQGSVVSNPIAESGPPVSHTSDITTSRTLTHRQQRLEAGDQPTTYEKQTQMYERIMKDLTNRTVDDAMIRRLSPQFGRGWRRVFRHLNFADAEIDSTFQECGQVQETVHSLLVKWTRVASTPDVKTLVEALVRAEQIHITQAFRS